MVQDARNAAQSTCASYTRVYAKVYLRSISLKKTMYPYDDDSFDDELPGNGNYLDQPIKRVRISVIIFAAIMILTLLGGSFLQLFRAAPTLLGYWDSDYRLSLSSISPGDCNRAGSSSRTIDPDRLVCICGVMDAQQGNADVNIQLRGQQGRTLGEIALRDQTSGSFCRSLRLEDRLEPGDYVLIGTPRLSRDTIAQYFFTVRDNRPDI